MMENKYEDQFSGDLMYVLASASEELTQFSVTLRNRYQFTDARNHTELRLYESGWHFEKWVEATVDKEVGSAAVWMLTLSEAKGKWTLVATIEVTTTDLNVDLVDVVTADIEVLKKAIKKSVSELTRSLSENTDLKSHLGIVV